jgi:hypothetical protein
MSHSVKKRAKNETFSCAILLSLFSGVSRCDDNHAGVLMILETLSQALLSQTMASCGKWRVVAYFDSWANRFSNGFSGDLYHASDISE